MTRDELARHLFIHWHDEDGASPQWRDRWANEWDAGLVTDDDVAEMYATADRILANGGVPA